MNQPWAPHDGVAVLEPGEPATSTWIVCLGFMSCVEPYELQRFSMMAEMMRARLVVVETPGFGFSRSLVLRSERKALLRGDFRPVARRMLNRAIGTGLVPPTRRGLGLLGYSMGASIASAMSRVMATEHGERMIDRMVLVEPVGARAWSIPALVAARHLDDRHTLGYVRQTADWPSAVAHLNDRPHDRPVTDRWADELLLANAIRAGRIPADLSAALREVPGLRVVIARGRHSRMADRFSAASLIGAVRAAGGDPRLVEVPGYHGLWQSMPAVRELTERVVAQLAQPELS